MRGRATSVVLPALVVLGLVAVVAIASTGSTPGGSDDTRPPSESLLDTIFTLGLVGVAIGGVLLALRAHAAEGDRARGGVRPVRIARFGSLSTLVLLGVLHGGHVLALRGTGSLRRRQRGRRLRASPAPTPIPTTPEREAQPAYEPSVAWLPIVVVVGLVARRRSSRTSSRSDARSRGRRSGEALAEQLAVVLDETLDDLRAEADPRRAIIAAYARLERVLAANGVPRRHVRDVRRVPPARPPRPRARRASSRAPDGALHAG